MRLLQPIGIYLSLSLSHKRQPSHHFSPSKRPNTRERPAPSETSQLQSRVQTRATWQEQEDTHQCSACMRVRAARSTSCAVLDWYCCNSATDGLSKKRPFSYQKARVDGKKRRGRRRAGSCLLLPGGDALYNGASQAKADKG